MRVLLTNVGRRTYFIEYLNDIQNPDFELEIFVSDRSRNVASYNTNIKKFLLTPKVLNNYEKYISSLYENCSKYKINLIIPLSDLDLYFLSINKSKFKKIKTEILVSNKNVIEICENKLKLNNFLNKYRLPNTNIFQSVDEFKYPLIEKPINGSGSNNIKIIKKNEIKIPRKGYIYQEKITGTEFGLDILNDFKGNFVSYCLKKKIEMRAGETDKAITINNSSILKLSKKISKHLKHIGNLDCDLFIDKNKRVYIIDFNCRFGGGYPFTHSVGLNYIKYLLNDFANIKNSKLSLEYKEKYFAKGIKIY